MLYLLFSTLSCILIIVIVYTITTIKVYKKLFFVEYLAQKHTLYSSYPGGTAFYWHKIQSLVLTKTYGFIDHERNRVIRILIIYSLVNLMYKDLMSEAREGDKKLVKNRIKREKQKVVKNLKGTRFVKEF